MRSARPHAGRRAQKSKSRSFGTKASRAAGNVVYKGPLRGEEDDLRPFRTELKYHVQIQATAVASVATFNNVFDTSTVNSSSRWSSLKTIYQEWRPVGMIVDFYPSSRGGFVASSAPATIGINQSESVSPLVLAPYKGASTAFSSLLNAVEHADLAISSQNDYNHCEWRMDEADEGSWVNTSGTTPGAVGGIKMFGYATTVGATDIVSIGFAVITLIVQFRIPVATSLQATAPKPSCIAAAARDEFKEEYVKVSQESPSLARPTLSRESKTLLRTLLGDPQ
jgi:hypothetical protein